MNSSTTKRRLHRACLALIVLLYVFSVPWYREQGEPLTLWLGMPDWVTVALLCYVAVAIVNGLAWALTDVPDTLEEATSTTQATSAMGGAGDSGRADGAGAPR